MCQKWVNRVIEQDVQKQFVFYPLNSDHARKTLPPKLLRGDTLVLLENNEKTWLRAKAIFRILKLLGGKWSSLGFLAYVPGVDLFYRMVAHNRHLFE